MKGDYKQFFSQHEDYINKKVIKIYYILCLIPIIILLFSILGYYNYPIKLGIAAIVGMIIIAVVLNVLSLAKIPSYVMKYFLILGMQLVQFMYSCNINLQITVLYMIAPLFAILYFDPKFTFVSCVIACVSLVISTIIVAPQAVSIIWRDVTARYYVFTTGGTHVLEMIVASILLISASNIARNLMISLQKRNIKIDTMQNDLVYSFADMIESRDGTTGAHVKRTSQVVDAITNYIYENPEQFPYNLEKSDYKRIALAAPLHDIGKMKVPDSILSKPGKLTPEEYDIIKTHSEEGAKIIDKTMCKIEDPVYVKYAREMALSHHEKWNGQGYPEGLKGEEIPVSARIMAVADVFDALCSKRSYKEPCSIDEAFTIISDNSGIHFEPVLVNALFSIRDQLEKIYET